MTSAIDRDNPLFRMAEQFAGPLKQARQDLSSLSTLHPEFVRQGLAAMGVSATGEIKAGAAVGLGELFPHMLAQSLRLEDGDRRKLAAAWLALYGYIRLVDDSLDKYGHLDGRVSMVASALLGWGLATVSSYTVGTKYEAMFLDNVNRSFYGQYEDVSNKSKIDASRAQSDVDKNRVFVAVAIGFCAAADQSDDRLNQALADDRLVRSLESSVGAWQILDDLEDVKEDFDENNFTAFVRIARECIASVPHPTRSEIYRALIKDPRTKILLQGAAKTIQESLLLLDVNRDFALVDYIGSLHRRVEALISVLEDYQHNPPLVAPAAVEERIELIAAGYSPSI
jgi:hypothetical protein